jgi:iron complex outermembrane receptor protein
MRLRNKLLCGAGFCLTISMTAGGHFQAASAQTAAAPQPEMIETVVVTARKRAESAQKAPVAVTAIDAAQIARMFVQNLADLDHKAPNFTIEGVGAIHRNAAVIYSRGIGYPGVDMGQDPAVGVSVNGVFPTRNIGMMSNTQDIDHVEILRGPQGTLFGKNTVGGVINITTKKPGDEWVVEANGRVGNLGRADYFVATDLPVNDTLAFRVSFLSQNATGAFTNAYTGPVQQLFAPYPQNLPLPKHLGGENIKTLRGTAVWKPIENFEADLVYTYMKDRSASVGGQNGSTPCSQATALGYCDALATFFGYPGYDYRTPGLPYPLGPNPPYTVHRNFPSGDFQDTQNITFNMRYHAADFDVVSVTGFIHDSNLSLNDYDDVELNFFESTFGLHSDQFSQELRLESNNDNSPLKWVGGVLYSSRDWDGTQMFYSIFPTLNNYIDYSRQSDNAWAGFGQVDYSVTKDLELTAGLRYTVEAKDVYRIPSHYAPGPFPGSFFFNKTWTNLSYKLGADYHIDDDKMVYVSYSTGFVAGGFNTRVDTAQLTGLPYAPEKVGAWEIGLKSDWYDHRLRANVALFDNHYSDLQVGAFLPGAGLQQAILNDAFESAKGAELEVTAIPIDHLTLSSSIGYLDAHFTRFFTDLLGTGTPADFSWLPVERAPKWTMHFEAFYELELNGRGVLTPDVSYEYQSRSYTADVDPVGIQKPYGMVDASLSYEEPKGRWKLSLWGKNLNNVLRRLSAVPSSGYFTQLYFDNPRTYGVDLTIKVDGSTF